MKSEFDLGRLIGQREALDFVAARCSAAGAELLRQLREGKDYGDCDTWDEFCPKYLHMGKDNANRIIRILDEFGPRYFEISQLTRISPATYRLIEPAIQDGALHSNGEAIALIPENADKVAAAVAELRRVAKAKEAPAVAVEVVEPVPPPDPFDELREEFQRVVARFEALVRQTRDRDRLAAALGACRLRLQMMERAL
jgi:hypothetical protein